MAREETARLVFFYAGGDEERNVRRMAPSGRWNVEDVGRDEHKHRNPNTFYHFEKLQKLKFLSSAIAQKFPFIESEKKSQRKIRQ